MRLLTVAVLALACITGAARADHAPAVCAATQEDFLASAANLKAKVLVASDEARDKVIAKINEARAQAGQWAFEADKLVLGIISDKGRLFVGTAMFKDHCVVPGTVKVFEAELWVQFIMDLGLSMDDFKPEQGA